MKATEQVGPIDAVFEGGGVKGIALSGALSVMEERGAVFQRVAGTSAGALVAALVAAGFRAQDVCHMLMDRDLAGATDLGLVPLAGLGLFRGDKLLTFVRQKLGGRTFADFVLDPNETDPRYRYKLHIIATDLSRGRMLVLPDDLPSYGLNPNDFEVAEAVRMSMSAPFFFYASRLRWKNELDRVRESVVVDGGVLSNFPLELFDSPRGRRPRHPTLGFKIQDDGEYKIRGPLALAQKAWALVNTACSGNDMRAITRFDRQKAERTIKVPVSGVSAVNFWISDERKEQLYRSGQEAARTFLDGWDFERYIEEYRKDVWASSDQNGGRAEQNRAEQNRAEQNRAEQSSGRMARA